MKKLLSVLLVFAIVLSFTACGGNSEAKEALNKGLTALKNFDAEGISKYFVGGELTEDELGITGAEEAKAIFSSFSWKIKNCVEKEDTATASVELTCVSLSGIVAELVSDMMNEMMQGNVTTENTEEYVLERMNEMIKDPKAPKTTQTITLTLQKVDEQWKISNPQAIVAMLTLGLEGIVGGEK